MTFRIRLVLIALFVIMVMLACRAPFMATPVAKVEGDLPVLRPSATPTPTFTPTATFTPTPTPTPTYTPTPTITPTPSITPTPTATTLPLNLQLRVFEDIWAIINEGYVYPDFNGLDWNAIHIEYRALVESGLTNAEFYNAMIEMIMRLGDEHSFLLDPDTAAEAAAEAQGQHDYVGIGVMLQPVPERNRAVILAVFANSPASEAGIRPRDSILSVDGVPIIGEDGYMQDIVRGPEGSTATYVIQTPGEDPRELTITRRQIAGELPLTYQVITSPNGLRVGYILLIGFDVENVDEQVEAALRDMNSAAPLDGLILDNRMNGGGSSTVLEPMLGFFTGGNVGSFVSRFEDRPLNIRSENINGSQNIPLVVLVGTGTASFGEIFSGVLRDIGRAYIIGTTTDGNVEILWGYDLDDGSQLWIASETFRPRYHPEENWEATGIIPDLTVEGEFDENSLENDPPVIAALDYFDSLP